MAPDCFGTWLDPLQPGATTNVTVRAEAQHRVDFVSRRLPEGSLEICHGN
jgi:hypothetical protein